MTSRSKKNLIRTSATLLSVVVLLLLSVFVFLKRSLAPLDGQETLKNLSAPVEISRDDYGIPHISAQNKTDALRALGFVMASERLFQMEMSRHLTQGTLAEVVGDIALPSDKLYRSLAIRQSVEKMLAEQNHPQDLKMQSEMEAFCDGINQYVNTHPLPYEFAILGLHHLQPFTPMNAYIMTGHMAFSFGVALKNDVLMTSLAKKISTNKLHDLQNDRFDSPLKVADAFATLKPLLIAGENFAPAFDGSNAWLLGPQRSSSGKSIFANDPHIGFSHPSVWFEAAIHTPEFEVYGHYLPLIPFAVLGHTRHHAWGFTMSQTDDMDLYRETLDRTHKLVMFKKKWQPYKEWQEIIHVKNNPDVIVPMIETEHGPLLDAAMEEPGLALKWAFHNSHNDPLAALRQMAEAKNIHEFENSLKTGTAPGLNVMYADSENIATWMFGEVALKKNPNSDFILDGASGNDEYLRTLTWEEKPHMINPPSGVIVSANTRPAGIPTEVRGDWQADDRKATISYLLSEKKQWSPEELQRIQTTNYNLRTPIILKKLLSELQLTPEEQKQYAPLLDLLQKWNFHSEVDSKEASLYYQWNDENLDILLREIPEHERKAYLRTTHAWVFYQRVLEEKNSPWWQTTSPSAVITAGFKKAATHWATLPQWGNIHTIEFTHALGRNFPGNLFFNLGPYPIPGAFNEINNNKQRSFSDDFNVVAGASTRRIVDLAHPETSWGINPIGISGHILSPYYKDEVELFLKGLYRPQLLTLENPSHKLTLITR